MSDERAAGASSDDGGALVLDPELVGAGRVLRSHHGGGFGDHLERPLVEPAAAKVLGLVGDLEVAVVAQATAKGLVERGEVWTGRGERSAVHVVEARIQCADRPVRPTDCDEPAAIGRVREAALGEELRAALT